MINVRQPPYSAVGDGSTDDATAFRAAVTTGEQIIVPVGNYRFDSPVSLPSGARLTGESRLGSVLLAGQPGMNILEIGNGSAPVESVIVEHIGFNALVPKTGGAAIKTNLVQSVNLEHLRIANQWNAVEMKDSVDIHLSDSWLPNSINVAVLIDGGNDQYLREVMATQPNGIQCRAAVEVLASAALYLDKFSGLSTGHGLLIDPPTGKVVEHVFSQQCVWDSLDGIGIYIVPVGIARRMKFIGDWTSTCRQQGLLAHGGGTIHDISLIGHRSYNNRSHGIHFAAGSDIAITDASVSGNGGANMPNLHGIVMGTNGAWIHGCRSGQMAGFGNTQGYGMYFVGTCNRVIATGNDLTGNITAGHNMPTCTSKIVKDNLT